MMTAELIMSSNVRRHVLMVDCCEICDTVTEEWDICRMHNIPVLACRPCQRKLNKVLHPITLEHCDAAAAYRSRAKGQS